MTETPIDTRTLTPAAMARMGYARTSRGDAIRNYCVDTCMCGSRNEVLMCASGQCPLWPFRMGNDPFREAREMTDEQRAAGADRLRMARESRGSTGD